MVVEGAPVPLVFTKPGSYEVPTKDGKPKPKMAFNKGVVYVRHGAKSEPATTRDLYDAIERRVEELRQLWLGGIRQVVEAPADANVAVYRPTELDEAGRPTKVRLTTEPGAPVYGMIDPDETHPYRETELIGKSTSGCRSARSDEPSTTMTFKPFGPCTRSMGHMLPSSLTNRSSHRPSSATHSPTGLLSESKDRDFLDRAPGYYELRFSA